MIDIDIDMDIAVEKEINVPVFFFWNNFFGKIKFQICLNIFVG